MRPYKDLYIGDTIPNGDPAETDIDDDDADGILDSEDSDVNGDGKTESHKNPA
ncbi:MAG: hypothetical protein WCS43_12715 [Verrucomicrobiota bacterium]